MLSSVLMLPTIHTQFKVEADAVEFRVPMVFWRFGSGSHGSWDGVCVRVELDGGDACLAVSFETPVFLAMIFAAIEGGQAASTHEGYEAWTATQMTEHSVGIGRVSLETRDHLQTGFG